MTVVPNAACSSGTAAASISRACAACVPRPSASLTASAAGTASHAVASWVPGHRNSPWKPWRRRNS